MNGRNPDLRDYREPGRSDFAGDGRAHAEGTERSADPYQQSIGRLLRRLATDVPELVSKEVALARAELSENLTSMRRGIVSMITGGAVLIPGVFVLLMSAVYGLATVTTLWLSALIVGGVITVIGLILLMAGKRKLEPSNLTPERTMHQMREDRDTLTGASHERTTTH